HGYLDNPTFRGMRRSLMDTFQKIRVVDLHGNANKKERSPDGIEDKNVFDIRQGVAISLASRSGVSAAVGHSHLWGSRESKYEWLAKHDVSDTDFVQLSPDSPFYFFEPQNTNCRAEYEVGWRVTEIFPVNGVGVVMARDSMTVDFHADALWERVNDFVSLPSEKARAKYSLGKDARDWRVVTAQADVRATGPTKKKICAILYRPFDERFTYYTGNSRGFYASPCRKVMSNMAEADNLGMGLSRSVEIGRFEHVFCTNKIIGHHSVSVKEVNYLFPLWILSTEKASISLLEDEAGRRPNLAPAFVRALTTALSAETYGVFGLPSGLTPEDIFHYAYAVFHSPSYRSRYVECLRADFPRMPLTASLGLFKALARLGGALVSLHLLQSPKLSQRVTEIVGGRNFEVEKVSWFENTVWIDKAQTTGFRGVRENVWNFHIGGYQVCEKWLKDRKGRRLSKDDITHFQKIVVALSETIRLMKEIDEVIEWHGGWPGAFLTEPIRETAAGGPAIPEDEPDAEEQGALFAEAGEQDGERPSTAEEVDNGSNRRSVEGLDADETACAIRQVFSAGGARDREAAVRELSEALGFQRVGPRIRERLDNAIRTAVRRGILENDGAGLRLQARSIEEYDRSFLKDQFLASLQGRSWTERDEAIRGLARWLGFRRTGPAIEDTARSLINGLIREQRLESDGDRIRRAD
ncbi:MAG: type ISP restriction/modification enzyme, partial [Vicinamibacterales bacterium]